MCNMSAVDACTPVNSVAPTPPLPLPALPPAGSFKRQTGFQLPPGALQLSSSGACAGWPTSLRASCCCVPSAPNCSLCRAPNASSAACQPHLCPGPPAPIPISVASAAPSSAMHIARHASGSGGGSGGRNGLLSQQMAEAPAPAGPPSVTGSDSHRTTTAPLYINGHGPPRGGGSAYGDAAVGGRSGAVTPEDQPGTRQGSKPASPKALEAQVAKLVAGQQQLSNQLEELALQISLAQSGLAVVPAAQQRALAAAAAAAAAEQQQQQQAAAGSSMAQHVRSLFFPSAPKEDSAASSLPPAAWAAAGALVGAAVALLAASARR